MSVVDVKVFYLEMVAHCQRTLTPPREGLTVVEAKSPSVAFYRFLNKTVGKEYHWTSRDQLADADLAAIITHLLHEIHVLYVDGSPAGFAELDRRSEGEIELVSFGLMPEFIGLGLGKWFLQWTIEKAWIRKPQRFWLHTCSLDHPAALPNYLKAGFPIYKEETIKREI